MPFKMCFLSNHTSPGSTISLDYVLDPYHSLARTAASPNPDLSLSGTTASPDLDLSPARTWASPDSDLSPAGQQLVLTRISVLLKHQPVLTHISVLLEQQTNLSRISVLLGQQPVLILYINPDHYSWSRQDIIYGLTNKTISLIILVLYTNPGQNI